MNDWINVKDRLPDESLVGREVLVCIRVRRKPFLIVSTAHWWGGDLRNNKSVWKSVSYWMPLPEPPKEDVG